ncbi:MAG: SWIM zinc finger family protein, partial [Candidatus Tectimicrobiota bacterium]
VQADGLCACPDATHRGVPCKHRLAVHLHQQALAQLAPSASPAPPPMAPTPQAATQEAGPQRPPSADRWDVKEAPASACLRLRVGELEILYTMRDITDAELTSRVQHLLPWVQDLLDQARERHAHLDAARQSRETAPTPPAVPPLPPPPIPPPSVPTDLQALLQQAVQQALAAQANGSGTTPANGTASSAPALDDQQTGFCSLHQVPMAQKQNARGIFYGHWLAAEQRHCNGRRAGRR